MVFSQLIFVIVYAYIPTVPDAELVLLNFGAQKQILKCVTPASS